MQLSIRRQVLMSEEQAKDLLAEAALEGLDEELSVEELEGVAGGGVNRAAATNPFAPKPPVGTFWTTDHRFGHKRK